MIEQEKVLLRRVLIWILLIAIPLVIIAIASR